MYKLKMLSGLVLLALLATSYCLTLPRIPTDFTQDDDVISAISDDIANGFAEEYMKYLKTGRESTALRQISEQITKARSTKDIFFQDIVELAQVDQFVACTSCRAVLKVVGDIFLSEEGELNGPNREAACKKGLLGVCDLLSLQTQEVCSAYFDLNYPIMEYILENTVADARSLCGVLPIKFCKTKQDAFEFSLKVDNSKPLLTAPKSEKPLKTDNDLHILHLTDIHYDPEYKAGTLAECDEPMCCNRMPVSNVDESQLAGYWSDYRDCDSPFYMIEDSFQQISEKFDKIDFIYHTGDIVPHNMWSTTKEGNIDMLAKIYSFMDSKFPEVPVYSCIGNHESHPSNVFGAPNLPANINVSWLYEHIWTLWSKWLPADTKNTVLKGGYYTVAPKPGHRIIALNNMDCYLYNWWVYLNGSIAIEQLQWLHDVLVAAEAAGEYVHILAHIPSADADCWTVWSREYNRIIERFSHIISGIFNGHTHKDEMNIHYSKNGHAMMVSWNGGSLTTYSNKNPNFKFYEVEPAKWQVVDAHTYIFNLTEANIHGAKQSPEWFLEYSITETFTDDLSPAGLDKLLVKMAETPDLLRMYWHYKMTSADPKLKQGCDTKCLMKTICRLATSVHNEKKRCRELQAILQTNLDIETPSTTLKPTSTSQPTTTEDPGNGVATLTASFTSTLGLWFFVKYFI